MENHSTSEIRLLTQEVGEKMHGVTTKQSRFDQGRIPLPWYMLGHINTGLGEGRFRGFGAGHGRPSRVVDRALRRSQWGLVVMAWSDHASSLV